MTNYIIEFHAILPFFFSTFKDFSKTISLSFPFPIPFLSFPIPFLSFPFLSFPFPFLPFFFPLFSFFLVHFSCLPDFPVFMGTLTVLAIPTHYLAHPRDIAHQIVVRKSGICQRLTILRNEMYTEKYTFIISNQY